MCFILRSLVKTFTTIEKPTLQQWNFRKTTAAIATSIKKLINIHHLNKHKSMTTEEQKPSNSTNLGKHDIRKVDKVQTTLEKLLGNSKDKTKLNHHGV